MNPYLGGVTPLELAAGHLLGRDREIATQLRFQQRSATPRAPLDSLRSAIARVVSERTFVEFSGGLDSSLVLAATVDVCRERGLPAPIPVTVRYPSAPETDESPYQQAMIDHLGLREHLIIEATDEFDLLGPAARQYLRSNGASCAARIPTRGHLYAHLEHGSVLLSGEGGDEAFRSAPLAPLRFVGTALATRRHRHGAIGWIGRTIRDLELPSRRLLRGAPDWLTPAAREQLSPAYRGTFGGRGRTMASSHRAYRSRRSLIAVIDELTTQAAGHGVTYAAPLLDLTFLAELTASTPNRDFVERNYYFHQHFASVLPRAILDRTTKVTFGRPIFGPDTAAFAASWNGVGLPDDLVQPELVRRAWQHTRDGRSALMLQHAWMVSEGLA